MNLGPLEVTFHRTVRVAEGRAASQLPPSLGYMRLHKVADHRKNCPENWADDAYFMALHDVEAMWMGFSSHGKPCAALIGAGGLNALDGEKLGTVLAKDNYVVCPPQPWLDGWKDKDGTVHQFVATPHKKGEGLSVAEQIIGAESKTGAIGIAIFEPKPDAKLNIQATPNQVWGQSSAFQTFNFDGGNLGATGCNTATIGAMSLNETLCNTSFTSDCAFEKSETVSKSILRSSRAVTEMGIGKGGKIIQKIYPDPHGLEVWNEKPTAVFAVYLVDAATTAEITGEKISTPAVHESYQGSWFGLKDQALGDVSGSDKFSGLKSAAFPGETENVSEEKQTAVTSS